MPDMSDLDALRDSFLIDLRAQSRSPGTVKQHGETVAGFIAWLRAEGRPLEVGTLTRAAIAEWLAHLGTPPPEGRGNAANTVRVRFMGLSRFCRFLLEEGELDAHPMRTLQPPDIEVPMVPVLDDSDLTALVKACAGRRWYDRRDEAIIRVLLDCGLRVAELCAMTVTDVDLKREMAIVMGKGRKQRAIYFSARTVRAVDRWIRVRRSHSHADAEALWLSERGPLSTDGVRWIVSQRAKQAGITDRMHPHRVRHTWAHDFLLSGGQQTDLKLLAGWDSDQQLARYGASAAHVRAREAARRLKRGDRI